MRDSTAEIVRMMRDVGLADAAVETFCHHYRGLLAGDTGTLDRRTIEPVSDLVDGDHLETHRDTGIAAINSVAVIKLNGGLGTSMGLERAKSLIKVRGDLSFLDLIAGQILAMRKETGVSIPLLLMNSFRTADDAESALSLYPELAAAGLPLGFLQNRVPKILADSLRPARHAEDPELEWCPPGHGDVYTALATSGILDSLLANGVNYAFISNADNLGAVLDPSILGYMIDRGVDFVMEVADRTPADRKGGHLCRLRDGRLALRESAQCPEDEVGEFQDVELYRYFNTNSIWVHLPTLSSLLDHHRGVLPLDTIVNRKNLNPRDPKSPGVIQLETAMGAALTLFPRAEAVRVDRSRFSPVKTTNDLLGVRSNAYVLTDDSRVSLHPSRTTPPTITLDSRFYAMIDDFERRFASGAPDLRNCTSLSVEGDVDFAAAVLLEGDVRIRAARGPAVIAEGHRISGQLELAPALEPA
jgi:UTP--glucose-1-phosphate uridylyltransferase